jgi:hypothetical protein
VIAAVAWHPAFVIGSKNHRPRAPEKRHRRRQSRIRMQVFRRWNHVDPRSRTKIEEALKEEALKKVRN